MVQNQVWLGQSSNYVCSNERCTNIAVSTEEFAGGMEQHSNYLCSNEDAKIRQAQIKRASMDKMGVSSIFSATELLSGHLNELTRI